MPEEKKENLDDILSPENTKEVNVVGSKKEEEPKENVTLSKAKFDELMSRLDRLEKTYNKKRLDQYDRLHDKNSETIYKLRTIDGKVIVRWSDLIKNKAEVDPISRRIIEDQPLIVYYEDGTEEEMQLIIFNRRYEQIFTTLIEEKILKKPEEIKKYGNRIYTVEAESGKKYEIGELFIN